MHNVGVILLQLLTKQHQPIKTFKTMTEVQENIAKGNITAPQELVNEGCTEDIIQWMSNISLNCVHEDLAARPTIKQVIRLFEDKGLWH